MASSKCPKCDSTSFEMKEITPKFSKWKYNTIQCSSCGAVVSIVEYFNIGVLIHKIFDKLGIDY